MLDGFTASQSSNDVPDFTTLDLLPYGIIVVDVEGKILYYNSREEQIACRKREDVIGKNFFRDVAPCTAVKEFYGRFREAMTNSGGVINFNFRFPFPGRTREVEIALTSFENGDALLCLISVSDVTEKNALLERLVRSERLSEIGEVAAGVAHNFNNLLTVISGNAELIHMRLPPDDPQRKRVETIMQAAQDGAKMVRRIRNTARQQPEAMRDTDPLDINKLLQDSLTFTEDYVRAAHTERNVQITLNTNFAAGLNPLRASANELREVFVNLLRNAVDAISGEGQVSINTRAENGTCFVEVTDTGEGMTTETQEKIFRPLFTTKGERGTGLGLATCYAIVRRHNGDIRVRSKQGEGTTFIVSLPVS